jgi:hypothetical protein
VKIKRSANGIYNTDFLFKKPLEQQEIQKVCANETDIKSNSILTSITAFKDFFIFGKRMYGRQRRSPRGIMGVHLES